MKVGGPVVETLRGYAAKAIDSVCTGDGRPYDPNDEQDDECSYVTADPEELLDTAVVERLKEGASLPQIKSDELRKRRLALYALLIGDDPDHRTAFIRRANPVSLASKSLVTVFEDTLTKLEAPILAFDAKFDVILNENNVWIMHQGNFEALFKESESVLAKTAEWTEELDSLIALSDESKDYLSERLRKTSVLRRKVTSLIRSKHMRSLTADDIREKIKAHGYDSSQLLNDDGKLILNKETERTLLLLLNEDIWIGDFSGEKYAATRKARRA
ncbi:Kiwa anti-phage protein KwaB-like domain-containing protein [Microbispora amethystogenes]|uniref:Kiwa anti-phage protein KwaB-like domain-containing protein n=1 Tax=Microbispora amethystogenes TaxID=1427754 RepID=UPI0033C84C87